jgi:hypothetical protein
MKVVHLATAFALRPVSFKLFGQIARRGALPLVGVEM